MHARNLLVALALALALPLPAAAADAQWKPTEPMQIIVAAGAGTAFDVMQRGMVRIWEKHFGVRGVVQNMPAAGGSLGFDRVATSKPDGHTLGFMSRSPYLGEMLKRSFPWKVEDVPLILAADTPPYVVTTGAKSPYKTWDDVRKAKTRIKLGIAGQISTDVVVIRDLIDHGVEPTTAQMGGTNQIVTGLQAGDLDVWTVVGSQTALDPIAAGHVRPLFVLANQRYAALPDTPTHIELGMPAEWVNVSAVRLWFASIKTPQNIKQGLAQRLTALLQDPEIADWNLKNGFLEKILTGEQATATQVGMHKIIRDNYDIFQKFGG
jgi:tripartite-type tricarboxylate transporter receptor subunit TctC